MLPQMKRDYQALALANSLDPKRFMKGGNKAGKVPERFAVSVPLHIGQTQAVGSTVPRMFFSTQGAGLVVLGVQSR